MSRAKPTEKASTASSKPLPWHALEVVPQADVYYIMHQGAPVSTKNGAHLAVPSAALAHVIVDEFAAQGTKLNAATMPCYGYASLAIDTIATERDQAIATIIGHLDTDCCCYRAPEPDALVQKQSALWNPLIVQWEARRGHPLVVTTGIMPIQQAKQAEQSLENWLTLQDTFSLMVLHQYVQLTTSCVIAEALYHGDITPKQAFEAAQCEALYQRSIWGEEEEATEKLQALQHELEQLASFKCLSEKKDQKGTVSN